MATRTAFDEALKVLQRDLLRMGSLVETAIQDSVQALVQGNIGLAEKVIAGDDVIDQLQIQLEDCCMKLIVTQQPMAKDLRRIGAAWHIAIDLERMADIAVNIAKAVRRMAKESLAKPLIDIPRMADLCQQMVRTGLDAYIREDEQLAWGLSELDDRLDALYKQVFRELVAVMLENPQTVAPVAHLLFIARFLERIGDHTTNIGESVIYLVTGEHTDLNE
ncbi:MAG: phosphate signaling complex protein PhoU [Heliobacteriaceae bacterium]|nr:phosphate signaling complex protein PhoU [Heliobacteriaceae bacterium]MDD4587476.1 phosphate signaling complex protein PhoU [Heliobacteriaceae bacterium]